MRLPSLILEGFIFKLMTWKVCSLMPLPFEAIGVEGFFFEALVFEYVVLVHSINTAPPSR